MQKTPAQKNLFNLFNPKSVAVIGASRDKKKIGSIAVRNILESGFKGKVYPINPNAKTIQKLKCYPDVSSLPEIPDLAIISIPSQIVPKLLEEIGEKGVKNVVIYSAGFKEIGEEGAKLESELLSISKKYSLNILGPNCLGFLNNSVPINTTFGSVIKNKGNLRFISQSGAIAASIFDYAKSSGLGFSEFITLGNKTVIDENNILEYWLENKFYSPIGMYLESLSDGKKFLNLSFKLVKNHPIFILKPGKSKAAKKSMQSHTGSMAGEDDVLDAALRQYGIIRCLGLEDIFDLFKAFSWGKIPKGNNLAILSNAGGPAVLSADLVSESGLKLAILSAKTKKILEENLPRYASIVNPIDVLGDALSDRYHVALEAVLKEENVDAVLVLLTPQVMTQIEDTAEVIVNLSQKSKKPVFCSFIGGTEVEKGERLLNEYKVPAFRYPERGIYALAKMWGWYKNSKVPYPSLRGVLSLSKDDEATSAQLDRFVPLSMASIPTIKQIVTHVKGYNRNTLNISESNEILKALKINVPATKVISSLEEAYDFANNNDYPIVLKISSSNLIHKTEVGGVVANIQSKEQLIENFRTIGSNLSKLDKEVKEKS